MLARLPDGTLFALDGREMAPAAAHRDMYLRDDGSADTSASRTGARAPGIPGSLPAYQQALAKHGKMPLATHLKRAAEVAERGFRIDKKYAGRLRGEAESLSTFAGPTSAFLHQDGTVLEAGEALVQADLARTYRSLAEHGLAWFYEGEFAEKTAAWMSANGGVITAKDFSNYRIRERTPLRTTYRGHEIIGFPPPSSGGTHVAQILNILENFDLAAQDEIDRLHLIIEAMKLAFADRAHWLGDADHVPVPVSGLISKAYARQLAARIDPAKASPDPIHGEPGPFAGDSAEKHTAHFTAVDQDGCWVACTATLNTSFGSKVVIPGTGVLLNNQMDDFSIKPGVANAFGLVGAEANAIAPGKRPLSSMSPTIVLRDGKPFLTVGAAGGPTIITQSLLTIINCIDRKLPLLDAVRTPRVHHQWKPATVSIERGLDPGIYAGLEKRGHTLLLTSSTGTCQAISYDETMHVFTAVSEPRGLGAAACVAAPAP
jgi:gamma-glutamyltranspeptidase/glutathione hydrolase